MALVRVVGPISGDAGDLVVGGDLAQEFGQQGVVANVTATGSELDGPNLQYVFVDPEMDRGRNAAHETAMLAGGSLTLPLDLRSSAAEQTMHPTLRNTMRDVHGKGLLATSGRAEIRYAPVQAEKSWLSKHPVTCRNAKPNGSFILRQVWMAASV